MAKQQTEEKERDKTSGGQQSSKSKCPECGAPIEDLRASCPECGYQYKDEDYDNPEAGMEFMAGKKVDDEGNELVSEKEKKKYGDSQKSGHYQ